MPWKARAGDRRNALRFEVVGTLAGSVTALETVPIINIGGGGALIETPWPLRQDSTHRVRLESPSHAASCQARVRHVTGIAEGKHYLIGLEFLDVDTLMLEEINRFVALEGTAPQ